MQSTLLIADLGPEFSGWAGAVDGKMVCVAPPEIAKDADGHRRMREIVRRSGGDCKTCQRCTFSEGA